MQHKNPIDIELTNSGTALYDAISNMLLTLDLSPDTMPVMRRFKTALSNAVIEMRTAEQLSRDEFTFTQAPPTSND